MTRLYREWRHDLFLMPKDEWGEGPWQEEPDKAQWVDEATDLDCLAVRHLNFGNWCGYVGVPKGHPFYGRGFEEEPIASMTAHGGVNHADGCHVVPEEFEVASVCHVPFPGRPDDVWWFGFDCAQGFDIAPAMEARLPKHLREERYHLFDAVDAPEYIKEAFTARYRTLQYVQMRCAELAQQIKDAQVSEVSTEVGGAH